jgi:hypothetical protein
MNVSPETIVVVDMVAVKRFSNSEKRNARALWLLTSGIVGDPCMFYFYCTKSCRDTMNFSDHEKEKGDECEKQ